MYITVPGLGAWSTGGLLASTLLALETVTAWRSGFPALGIGGGDCSGTALGDQAIKLSSSASVDIMKHC